MRPIVNLRLHADDDGVGILLENKGVGPALIKTFRFWRGPKEIGLTGAVDLMGIGGIVNNRGWYQEMAIGRTLSQNDRVRLIWYPEKTVYEFPAGMGGHIGHSAMYAAFMDGILFSRVSYDVCYCSIYEECWKGALSGDVKGDLKGYDPNPVPNCDDFQNSVP